MHWRPGMLLPLVLASLTGCLSSPDARALEGGQHQRFVTATGPVHEWCPEAWEPALRWLTPAERDRVLDPAFYELLQREVPRRAMQAAQRRSGLLAAIGPGPSS